MIDPAPPPLTPKQRAAIAAANLVHDGMTVGLGSGTTAALILKALGSRISTEGLRIIGVPTSVATAELAREMGIPLRELDSVEQLDVNLDGADEIDPKFRMIKGRGGALLREKILASVAQLRVTVVTSEKRVTTLGCKAPVPVEVSTIGTRHIAAKLSHLGAEPILRPRPDGQPYLTDGGNMILDCHFPQPFDPSTLDAELHQIVGVFETGLFIGLCDTLLVGEPHGVVRYDSPTFGLASSPL